MGLLSWEHIRVILGKVKEISVSLFYAAETREMDGPEMYWYFKLIEYITKFLFKLGKDFIFIKEEG